MSAGNRLNKDELRDEVKDYLITLREERIQRSIQVSERLKQLRAARIERMRDVRNSMTVTSAIRDRTTEEFSREGLKTRVQEMRSQVQDMLKKYKASRTGNLEFNGPGSADAEGTERRNVDNTRVANAVNPHYAENERAEVQPEEGYQNRLSQVITNLGKKTDDESAAETRVPEKSDQSAERSGKRKENTLMGRIRRLATGAYHKSDTPRKKAASAVLNSVTPQSKMLTPQEPAEQIETPQQNSPMSEMPGAAEPETVHTVIRRASDAIKEQGAESNELLEIMGIGPSVLKRLQRIGICTFQDLASASLPQLERSFGEYAKLTDLGDWVEQAKVKLRQA